MKCAECCGCDTIKCEVQVVGIVLQDTIRVEIRKKVDVGKFLFVFSALNSQNK